MILFSFLKSQISQLSSDVTFLWNLLERFPVYKRKCQPPFHVDFNLGSFPLHCLLIGNGNVSNEIVRTICSRRRLNLHFSHCNLLLGMIEKVNEKSYVVQRYEKGYFSSQSRFSLFIPSSISYSSINSKSEHERVLKVPTFEKLLSRCSLDPKYSCNQVWLAKYRNSFE